MLSIVTSQVIPAQTGTTLLARIVGANRAPMTQASLLSIAYVLTDLTLGTQQDAQTLTIASVLFNQLSTDNGWSKDSALNPAPPPPLGDGNYGWNFAYTVKAAVLFNGGDRYRADVIFTPVSGEPFRVPFEWRTLKVYG